jgi:hypothetical protein
MAAACCVVEKWRPFGWIWTSSAKNKEHHFGFFSELKISLPNTPKRGVQVRRLTSQSEKPRWLDCWVKDGLIDMRS